MQFLSLHWNDNCRYSCVNFVQVIAIWLERMIDRIDHVVLTTSHRDACIHFYTQILGMQLESFGEGRQAFLFGANKINLHIAGKEFEPKAHLPVPGSQDWCFIAKIPIGDVIQTLQQYNVDIIEGPVARTGSTGSITSVYVRDPDRNLLEIAVYDSGHTVVGH